MTPRRSKILVVDDDVSVLRALLRMLRANDYVTEGAVDGLAALDALRTSDFDCLLSDIDMPMLDGLGLAQRVRVLWPTLPVILFSGAHDRRAEARRGSLGVHAILSKPMTSEALCDAVEAAIDDARSLVGPR
jgi:CheY-like chemotaxis protein